MLRRFSNMNTSTPTSYSVELSHLSLFNCIDEGATAGLVMYSPMAL